MASRLRPDIISPASYPPECPDCLNRLFGHDPKSIESLSVHRRTMHKAAIYAHAAAG
jgi:hypothetical protein